MTLSSWPRLERLLARTTRVPLPSPAWLREGLLGPVLWPCLVVTLFGLAGITRTLTGLSLPAALALTAPLYVLALLPFVPALTARHAGDRLHRALGAAVVLGVVAFATYCLYSRYFGGLTNFRGTDAGFHASAYHQFATTETAPYNGFITTYALLYFVQHLFQVTLFWAFALVFYGEVAAVCALPLVIAFSLLWPLRHGRRGAYAAGVVMALAAGALTQYYVIGPQQHQNQADGFYGHLVGMAVLFAIWAADMLIRAVPLRAAALLLGFVVCRYTYGLNLGDLALALGVLFLLDAAAPRQRLFWRVLLGLGAFALFWAGRLAYHALWPVHQMGGHVVRYDVDAALHAMALALGVLALIVAGACGRRALFAGSGLRRAARFPLLFGLFNLAIVILYLRSGEPRVYYLFKYPLAAIVLLVAALSALVPPLVARALAELGSVGWRRALAPVAALTAAAMATQAVREQAAAQPEYQAGFLDRAWGKPPFTKELNMPLADLGAWRRIDDTLAQQHKKFGGYVISQFGLFMFMNAALELPNFNWSAWFSGPPNPPAKDSCLFWDEGKPNLWYVWEFGFPLRHLRDQLTHDPDKLCVHYRAHFDPDGPPRTLCHKCN